MTVLEPLIVQIRCLKRAVWNFGELCRYQYTFGKGWVSKTRINPQLHDNPQRTKLIIELGSLVYIACSSQTIQNIYKELEI